MAKIRIKGVEYKLRFDLSAMEAVEDEFGSLKAMFEALRAESGQVKLLRKLLTIMLNCQLDFEGSEKRFTEGELKHLPTTAMAVAKQALQDGMKAETVDGGEADDDVHDGYLEEIERDEKNG